MRYRDFAVEAPIEDLGTFGDFDKFDPDDHDGDYIDNPSKKMLTNPKYIKKLRNAFEKTPHLFNLYFVSDKASDHMIWDKYESEIKSRISKANPDAINMVFTNNVTADYYPMTPWIIAHRMAHLFQGGGGGEHAKKIEYLWQTFAHDFGKTIGSDPGDPGTSFGHQDFTKQKEVFFRTATMKSARSKRLANALDFIGEFIAQYLITGKVTMNTDQENGDITKKFENDMNKLLKSEFSKMKGKTFDF